MQKGGVDVMIQGQDENLLSLRDLLLGRGKQLNVFQMFCATTPIIIYCCL